MVRLVLDILELARKRRDRHHEAEEAGQIDMFATLPEPEPVAPVGREHLRLLPARVDPTVRRWQDIGPEVARPGGPTATDRAVGLGVGPWLRPVVPASPPPVVVLPEPAPAPPEPVKPKANTPRPRGYARAGTREVGQRVRLSDGSLWVVSRVGKRYRAHDDIGSFSGGDPMDAGEWVENITYRKATRAEVKADQEERARVRTAEERKRDAEGRAEAARKAIDAHLPKAGQLYAYLRRSGDPEGPVQPPAAVTDVQFPVQAIDLSEAHSSYDDYREGLSLIRDAAGKTFMYGWGGFGVLHEVSGAAWDKALEVREVLRAAVAEQVELKGDAPKPFPAIGDLYWADRHDDDALRDPLRGAHAGRTKEEAAAKSATALESKRALELARAEAEQRRTFAQEILDAAHEAIVGDGAVDDAYKYSASARLAEIGAAYPDAEEAARVAARVVTEAWTETQARVADAEATKAAAKSKRAKMRGSRTAQWTKYRGQWALKADKLEEGDRIEVTTRDGRTQKVRVGEILFDNGDYTIAAKG